LGNGGENNSGFTLAPGNYVVCELSLAVAWAATVTVNGVSGTFVNPDAPADVGNRCITVALAYGDSKTVVVTNNPPPGGGTRTIGYWKNHASCSESNGGQYQKTIDKGFPDAVTDPHLDALVNLGLLAGPLNCDQAWDLLSKNALDGSPRPGDPIYNMVAQLVGALLNLDAGAGTCPAVVNAIADARTLLTAVQFDGLKYYSGKNQNFTLTAQQKADANTLNGILGSYNEGSLPAPCPGHV
jgi:hypothetical protein